MTMRYDLHQNRRSFTLVELLVVIGIIVCLMTILLGVVWKVYRRAAVLSCPIAYIGNDHVLHLTDPSGKADIRLFSQTDPVRLNSGSYYPRQVQWAPSGMHLAAPCYEPNGTRTIVGVFDIKTGVAKACAVDPGVNFAGWLDSWHVTAADRNKLDTLVCADIESGAVDRKVKLPFENVFGYGVISPAPLTCSRGRYVTMRAAGAKNDSTGIDIVLLNKDLKISRIVWQAPDRKTVNAHPRIDPMGEWVGWTMSWSDNNQRVSRIAIKGVNQACSELPTMIGEQFPAAIFCDWTEDGRVLANVAKELDKNNRPTKWALVILDRRGNLINEIPTAVPPQDETSAAWRKYGHQ